MSDIEVVTADLRHAAEQIGSAADARAQRQDLDASAASYDGTDEVVPSDLARHDVGAQ